MATLFLKYILFFALAVLINAELLGGNMPGNAIQPYAYNMARVIQDFEASKSLKHLRPEKFTVIDTYSDNVSLLWVSTFDESFGCLFSCAGGRLQKLLDTGLSKQGEISQLGFRNNVMYVTSVKENQSEAQCRFYRYKGGVLDTLDLRYTETNGKDGFYTNGKGKKVNSDKAEKELNKGLKKGQNPALLISSDMEWIPFRKIGNFLEIDDDITLSQMPVLSYANYNDNEFRTHAQNMLNAESYRHIIFKKQVGEACLKSCSSNNVVFSLKNPKDIKTMFRGYKAGELYPILATDKYLESHTMMPFKRWKHPERVTPMEKDKQRAVSDHFGGRAIKNARWLADLEESDRKLYAVEFTTTGNQTLAVIACFIGNRLVSTFDQYAIVDPGRSWLWTPGDKCDFMKALPELQGLAVTDEGFELYLSQMVGEKRHMLVLREVGNMFVELINQEF